MNGNIYDYLEIPYECMLSKRIYKKLFHENVKFSATDKKAFREDIENIMWWYTLKPSTMPIRSYEDENCEYHEIAVLQVNMKTDRRHKRIAEIIHRAIPYPVMLTFWQIDTASVCALSVAHKRFSQAEKGAIVAEDIYTTDWLDIYALSAMEKAFLEDLNIKNLTHTDFRTFYSGWVDRFLAFECAELNGTYQVESVNKRRQRRKENLTACHQLQIEVADKRAAIKKETQFNRQVELNTQIKQMEQKLRELADEL